MALLSGASLKKPLLTLFQAFKAGGKTVQLLFADRKFVTGSADTPTDMAFDVRVLQGITWDRSIVGPRIGGRGDFRGGEIRLSNMDGGLTNILDTYAIDGRKVAVRFGGTNFKHKNFVSLFGGTAAGWRRNRRGEVFIQPRGTSWRLNLPIQSTRYAGTGGAEGGADLEGKPKPIALGGELLNVPIVLVEGTKNIYQFHDGKANAVNGVFDRANALTQADDNGGTYASYSDLESATTGTAGSGAEIEEGEYAISLSSDGSYIRLGGTPDGLVTADLDGGLFNGSYVQTPSDVLKFVLQTYGGLSDRDLELGSFRQLNNAVSDPIGLWIGPDDRNLPSVLDEIVDSFEGFYGDTRKGKIQVGQTQKPSGGVSAEIEEDDLLDFQWLTMPEAIRPAVKTATVGYDRVYAVQNTDIAGAATDARRGLVQRERRFVSGNTSGLASFHLRATELTIPGLWTTKVGASNHEAHLRGLYDRNARLARATIGHRGFLLGINQKVRLNAPRYGVDSRRFRIVGVSVDARRKRVTLTLFQ